MPAKKELCFACDKWPAETQGLCMSCQMAMSMIVVFGHPQERYRNGAEAIFGAQIVYAKVGRPEAVAFLDAQLRDAGLLGTGEEGAHEE